MRRRICSWSSIGLLCLLYTIGSDAILAAYNDRNAQIPFVADSSRSDRSLVLMLGEISPDELRHLARNSPSPVNLDNLKREKQKANETEVYSIYNEDTCVEFHHLLVAVLMSCAMALTNLKEYDGCSVADRRKWLPLVHNFTCLLWNIVESRAFRIHLQVINDLLLIPSAESQSISTYAIFAKLHGLHFIDVTGIVDTSAVREEPGYLAVEPEQDFEDENEQIPDVSHGLAHSRAQLHLDCRRRIKSLLTHCIGIYTISQYCATLAKTTSCPILFNSNVIAVPPPAQAKVSWSGIEEVLNTVCPGTSRHQPEEFSMAIQHIATVKCEQGTRNHFIVHKVSKMIRAFLQATTSPLNPTGPHHAPDFTAVLEDRNKLSEVLFAGLPHCELSFFALLAILSREGRYQGEAKPKRHSGIDESIYELFDLKALSVRSPLMII